MEIPEQEKRDKARMKAAKQRATKARKFCVNTCPASRHVHMMAEALSKGQKYHMLNEEPEHCAGSLLSVITSLWEARDQLIKLQGYWYKPIRRERKQHAALIRGSSHRGAE